MLTQFHSQTLGTLYYAVSKRGQIQLKTLMVYSGLSSHLPARGGKNALSQTWPRWYPVSSITDLHVLELGSKGAHRPLAVWGWAPHIKMKKGRFLGDKPLDV